MWLSFLLIVVISILIGLFVHHFCEKFYACEKCNNKKKSSSAWENLQKHTSTKNTHANSNNNMVNDILGSDDDL
jgi:hypothetical protein